MSKKVQTRIFPSGVKGEILEVSLRCFLKYGYGGTTLAELARSLKMSKPRILYHFKTPHQIFMELFKRWAELGQSTTIDFLAEHHFDSAEDKVAGIVEATMLWLERYRDLAGLTPIIVHAANQNPEVQQNLKVVLDAGKDRIYFTLKHSAKFQKISATQLREYVQGVHSLIIGCLLYSLALNIVDVRPLTQQTKKLILNLLRTSK